MNEPDRPGEIPVARPIEPGRDPLLMTPGPTRIPERVFRASLRNLHHRSPEFLDILARCLQSLRPLLGARSADILPVHGTGRAAMEGAILSFFSAGDTIIACCNGKFGRMWAGLGEIHGLRVIRIESDWDRSVDPDAVRRAIYAHPEARAVTIVHSDTSTGVLNPVAQVAALARNRGLLVLVDAISAAGGVPFGFDAWDLDIAVTSSQKCLMSSPGLAFAVVGPRAWTANRARRVLSSYLDFGSIRTSLDSPRPETPGTTPVSLVLQVTEALRMIAEEGLDHVFERHELLADTVRTRARSLGFSLQGGAGIDLRSPTLTALRVPEGVEPASLRRALLRKGIRIAAGIGEYEAGSIRIGHMGDIRIPEVEMTMDALADALGEV